MPGWRPTVIAQVFTSDPLPSKKNDKKKQKKRLHSSSCVINNIEHASQDETQLSEHDIAKNNEPWDDEAHNENYAIHELVSSEEVTSSPQIDLSIYSEPEHPEDLADHSSGMSPLNSSISEPPLSIDIDDSEAHMISIENEHKSVTECESVPSESSVQILSSAVSFETVAERLVYCVQGGPSEDYAPVCETLRLALIPLGWEEANGSKDFNVLWSWRAAVIDWKSLKCWQRVNHFPGNRHLVQKDFLKRRLINCPYFPETYLLPSEYVKFAKKFKQGDLWIMKPGRGSRGRGVKVIDDLSGVTYSEPFLVQRYISNPYLYFGKKFDLRVYVLVTSFNPLEAFLYKEGLVRIASKSYHTKSDSLNDTLVHITNSAIQGDKGGKITFGELVKSGIFQAGLWDLEIWPALTQVVLTTLKKTQINIPFNKNAFELFGFDILVQSESKPKVWLLEVNASPSLGLYTPADYSVKIPLIRDVARIVTTGREQTQTSNRPSFTEQTDSYGNFQCIA